jgi:small ligand-binding sensory domain FIST
MRAFLHAHATHPDWHMALAMALAQLESQRELQGDDPPYTLGWIYLTDHYAGEAEALVQALHQQWPGVDWVGSVGVGVAASGVEYIDEPALALMLSTLPRSQYQLFSGRQPLGPFDAATVQVHADGRTPELPELLGELADLTRSGYLFGGLAGSRSRSVHVAGEVWEGGLSGVAFASEVALLSRVTQGCQPVGPVRTVTEVAQNVVYTLDHLPALDCLLKDLGTTLGQPEGLDVRQMLPRLRSTLAGLSDEGDTTLSWPGQFGTDTRVRHLIGLEPSRRGLALADTAAEGMQLAFCQRNVEAARRDLVRICAEIREEVEAEAHSPTDLRAPAGVEAAAQARQRMVGAVYVSCAGRGGPHFGGPSAELQIIRHALGDVPLVGFFAGGEIAHRHLYGYTGVLTLFLDRG